MGLDLGGKEVQETDLRGLVETSLPLQQQPRGGRQAEEKGLRDTIASVTPQGPSAHLFS